MVKFLRNRKGQSIVEVLISVAIAALIIGSATVAINLAIKSGSSSKTISAAVPLAEELIDKARVVAEADWTNIYSPLGTSNKNSPNHYYFAPGALTLVAASPADSGETITINENDFVRYFYIQDVNRTNCGRGDISLSSNVPCSSGAEISEDPSTQKITAEVKLDGAVVISLSEYITRRTNVITHDTDWTDIPAGDKSGVATPPGEIKL